MRRARFLARRFLCYSKKSMISVVIPVRNEKESVSSLHAELLSVLQEIGKPYEIIYVDDGSKDGTFDELAKLARVTVIRFVRNFGKSQALRAGFEEAAGEYIITMDGDLQDDPQEIPAFIREIEATGADLVVGWKRRRLDPGRRKLASRVANAVTRFATGVRVHDMNCGFKIYRRDVAKQLVLYGDLHRFIPAIAASFGYEVREMPVNHRSRLYGASKYGFSRLITSGFDFFSLLFLRRSTDRPMHFFGSAGLLSGTIGLGILAYLSILKLTTNALIGDRPLLLLGILLLLLGVQLLSLGFIGDLIVRSGPSGARSFIIKEMRREP